MDIKLLSDEKNENSMSAEAFASIANRQKRREAFFRSLIRCAASTLLFISAGCFFAVYVQKTDLYALILNKDPTALSGFKELLKKFFVISVIPSISFFAGRTALYRLCDTLMPALHGAFYGSALYVIMSDLVEKHSFTYVMLYVPQILFIIIVLLALTVFGAVCSSYGECLKKSFVTVEDKNSYVKYYMITLTAILLSVILKELSVGLLYIFGQV